MKKIFIINGMGGCGKDTFVKFVSELVPTRHISIIGQTKAIAQFVGWNGEKDEKSRKFLCDLKEIIDNYNDSNFKYITKLVNEFKEDKETQYLFIDIRDPKQIERAEKEFDAYSILIKRDDIQAITSNKADAGVFDYNYHCVVNNNGTLKDLEDAAKEFVDVFNDDESLLDDSDYFLKNLIEWSQLPDEKKKEIFTKSQEVLQGLVKYLLGD